MDFILLIFIVASLLYFRGISERVHRLEKRLASRDSLPEIASSARTTPSAVDHPIAVSSIPDDSLTDFVKTNTESGQVPPWQKDLSNISPTQWVAGIGALALLFGIGFFLRYAIDQGWINEVMRVMLGVIVGLLLVVLGELWKKKYTQYASVLTGTGLAILYFSIFASYQFYDQIPQSVAFLLMVLLTISGVVLSYWYNSKAIATLAVLGGYLSPILLYSGKDQHMVLFMYLTVLNIGVLIMLLKEYWVELLFLALLGSGIIFGAWAAQFAAASNTAASVSFVVLNYLLVGFLTTLLFHKLHSENKLPKETDVHLGAFYTIFGFVVFGVVAALLDGKYEVYRAPIMLLLSVITFMSYVVIDRLNYLKINYPLSLIGAKFLVAAILWQFDGMVANVYLLAASMIGIGVGFAVNRKELRFWGLLVLVIATIKIFVDDYATTALFANARFAVEILAAILFAITTWGFEKYLPEGEERQAATFTKIGAAAIVWLAVSIEIASNLGSIDETNTRNLTLSIWWMAYAVVLAVLGSFKRLTELRRAAVVLFALAVLKVFLYDVLALDIGYRIVSFIALGIILLSVSFAYQKNKEKLQKFWEGENKEMPNA